MTISFQSIIDAICNHSMLTIPNVTDTYCVFVDASSKGVGGVLCVCRNGEWLPCAFYSRQLLDRESKFSATELEALALLSTVEHFKYYLGGRHFTAYTDHQALKPIFEGIPPSNRLLRWKDKLDLYDMNIIYLPGKQNVMADALSRQGWPEADVQQLPEQGGDVV